MRKQKLFMNFDFIEIGANTWRNLYTRKNGIGIIIEPVTEYFKKIPSLPNLIRINAAIVDDKVELREDGRIEFFYFSESYIPEDKPWLRGCGSIFPNQNRNFNEYKKRTVVPAINIRSLFQTYDVKEVDYLKFDVEGMDSRLLYSLLTWNKCPFIKTVQFEANIKTNQKDLELVKSALIEKGFEIIKETKQDIIAENRTIETL